MQEHADTVTEEIEKKSIVKYLVWVPVMILLLIVVGTLLTREGDVGGHKMRPKIGETARDFTFPDLNNKPVTLSSFVGDKVVLVNIWATWCTSCKAEMPTMQSLYEKYKGDDFEVLAVSIDALGAKAIIPYMNKMGLTFPALQNLSGSIQKLYGTTGVPESFVVDKQGKIALVEVGAGDWREAHKQALIKSLMEEPDKADYRKL
jgi:peroxiredoxin